MYIDKLDDIGNKYNTCHITIKMKPVDVKSNTYTNFAIENNDKNPKFKVGDNVRMKKCKTIFAKGYAPNLSEEIFVIKNVENTALWTYVILMLKKLLKRLCVINWLKLLITTDALDLVKNAEYVIDADCLIS